MSTLVVKVKAQMAAKIARLAKRRGVSKSDIVRDVLEKGLDADDEGLADIADLVGSFDGPADLSSNPDHLRGYGRRK